MTPYKRFASSQLILRDELALDRTRLANERTFLAYARTAIMLVVSGVTLVKFFPDQFWMEMLAVGLIPGGIAVILVGTLRYIRLQRALSMLRPLDLQADQSLDKPADREGDI